MSNPFHIHSEHFQYVAWERLRVRDDDGRIRNLLDELAIVHRDCYGTAIKRAEEKGHREGFKQGVAAAAAAGEVVASAAAQAKAKKLHPAGKKGGDSELVIVPPRELKPIKGGKDDQ